MIERQSGATFITDTFTDSDLTWLESHVGQTGATWAVHPAKPALEARILSNRAVHRIISPPPLDADGLYYASGVGSGADYEVSADVYFGSAPSSLIAYATLGLLVRLDTAAFTGYEAEIGTTLARIVRWNAGIQTVPSQTNTAYGAISAGATKTVKLRAMGSSLELEIDGTVVAVLEDSSPITSAGRVGVRLFGNIIGATVTPDVEIDSITAYDLWAIPPVPSWYSENMQECEEFPLLNIVMPPYRDASAVVVSLRGMTPINGQFVICAEIDFTEGYISGVSVWDSLGKPSSVIMHTLKPKGAGVATLNTDTGVVTVFDPTYHEEYRAGMPCDGFTLWLLGE